MKKSVAVEEIPGAAQIISRFGRWPSFHDAEVVSVRLHRKEESSLKFYVFEMTNEITAAGYYKLTNHCYITFYMEDVFACTLVDFNHQNVIFGLSLMHDEQGWLIELDPCFGLSGTVRAKTLRFEVEPAEPRYPEAA